MYWVVEYDCRETDVEIHGIVPPASRPNPPKLKDVY